MKSYDSVHRLLKIHRGPAWQHGCCGCGLGAQHWAYDHEDPAEVVDSRDRHYSLDLGHYLPLCARCHYRFDIQFSPYRRGLNMACAEYPLPSCVEVSKRLNLWPPPPRPPWPLDLTTSGSLTA